MCELATSHTLQSTTHALSSTGAPPGAAMIRRLSLRRAVAAIPHLYRRPFLPPPSISRPFSSGPGPGAVAVARQIIDYALHHSRSHRSEESYAQALLVLEQDLVSLNQPEVLDDDAFGMVLLSMATVLTEKGDMVGAIEKLQQVLDSPVLDSPRFSSVVRVAAFEALTGLYLEMGQDSVASILVDKYVQTLSEGQDADRDVRLWAIAAKGLVNLVIGDLASADLCFSVPRENECLDHKLLPEYLHSTGKHVLAKGFYQKALEASSTPNIDGERYLAGSNMIPEEVSLGATCTLGQLAMHSKNFLEAEEILTRALTKAEEFFVPKHPKVGIVLTSLALMFGHKTKMERSSSLMIQEGLYRRAIELLKAPPLETEVREAPLRDLVALGRGGYAEALCVQQNGREEGERMRQWAEKAWRNSRLTLAEALDITEASKVIVVDTRISRLI